MLDYALIELFLVETLLSLIVCFLYSWVSLSSIVIVFPVFLSLKVDVLDSL